MHYRTAQSRASAGGRGKKYDMHLSLQVTTVSTIDQYPVRLPRVYFYTSDCGLHGPRANPDVRLDPFPNGMGTSRTRRTAQAVQCKAPLTYFSRDCLALHFRLRTSQLTRESECSFRYRCRRLAANCSPYQTANVLRGDAALHDAALLERPRH